MQNTVVTKNTHTHRSDWRNIEARVISWGIPLFRENHPDCDFITDDEIIGMPEINNYFANHYTEPYYNGFGVDPSWAAFVNVMDAMQTRGEESRETRRRNRLMEAPAVDTYLVARRSHGNERKAIMNNINKFIGRGLDNNTVIIGGRVHTLGDIEKKEMIAK